MREPEDTVDIDEMQCQVVDWMRRKGWLEDNRTFTEACMLIVTELGEAVDAWRDHGLEGPMFQYRSMGAPNYRSSPQNEEGVLGKPVHAASEIADVLVRLLDLAYRFDIDLVGEFHRKMEFNETRSRRHGGKRL